VPWAEDEHFRPEDMMVLCPNCHDLCKPNVLNELEQRKLKARPKNIVDGKAKGLLFAMSNQLFARLGGGLAQNTPTLLRIAGEPVVTLKLNDDDGRVLVSSTIQNNLGETVGVIDDNEWQLNSTAVWDFESSPNSAAVRLKPADIAFEIKVVGAEIHLRGNWYFNKKKITFTPSEFSYAGTVAVGLNSRFCETHVSIR
jgi:hypothetical protein